MPFLAAAPLLTSLIGAGASAGLSRLIGGGGGRRNQTSAADQALTQQIQHQQQRDDSIYNEFAAPSWRSATGYYNQVGNIWSGLLGNTAQGRLIQNQLLGPSRDLRARQSQSNLRQLGQFGARGGGQSSSLSNLLFQNRGDNNRDLLGLRQSAIGGLEGVGNDFASLGTGAMGAAGQRGSDATNALLGQSNQQLQQRLANQNRNAGIFSSIGQIGGSLLGDYLNRGNSLSSNRSSSRSSGFNLGSLTSLFPDLLGGG